MEPIAVVGVVVGLLAFIFAVGVTLWAIKVARRGMHSAARTGVDPIPKSELVSLLLQLNNTQHPFHLNPSSETDLTIEWCVVDAKWIEVLGRASSKMTYRAWILFDETNHTAKYWEQLLEASLVAGGGGVFSESRTSSGFELWGRRTAHRWGVRSDYSVGEVLNYKFTPSDVKDLVRQIANDHGWNFDLVLFQRQAKYA